MILLSDLIYLDTFFTNLEGGS